MESRERCRNKLRVLRSNQKKNPFYELPPATRKVVPVEIKSEFNDSNRIQIFESTNQVIEHKTKIKIEPGSPTLLSYNNDITYDGYWLRKSTMKKSYCESLPSSSPEVIFNRIRRNSDEANKCLNSTRRSRRISTESRDEENSFLVQESALCNIKSENNLAKNEIGVMDKPSIPNFPRNFKFSNNSAMSIKQELTETDDYEVMNIGSFNESFKIEKVETLLIPNFKVKPSQTIVKEIDLIKDIETNPSSESLPDCIEVPIEHNSVNNQSIIIVSCDEDVTTPVNKSKINRDFKKKLDFGVDSTPSNFIEIDYEEENVDVLNVLENETTSNSQLNSSYERVIVINLTDCNDRNLRKTSDVVEISDTNGSDANEKTDLKMGYYIAEKTDSQIPLPVPAVLEKNPFLTITEIDKKGSNVLECDGDFDVIFTEENSDSFNVDTIEPSIKTLLDSKLLNLIINDLTQDEENLRPFCTPGYFSDYDCVVPNSDGSLCSSPENSILETKTPKKYVKVSQEKSILSVPVDTLLIGIPSHFFADEINNNFSESPTENVSTKYNNFAKNMDQNLLELTNEKLLPLANRNINYYNLDAMDADAKKLDLELINEVIKEDLENGNNRKNCASLNPICKITNVRSNFDYTKEENAGDKGFDNEMVDYLGDLLDSDCEEFADSSTTFAHEMSSVSNSLVRKISHEQLINKSDEVLETRNINNKKCLKKINNDHRPAGNSMDTSFYEENLSNSFKMPKTERTINTELKITLDNGIDENISNDQTLLNTGNNKNNKCFREPTMNNIPGLLKVKNTTNEKIFPATNIGSMNNIISPGAKICPRAERTPSILNCCDEIMNNGDRILKFESEELVNRKHYDTRTNKYVSKEQNLPITGNVIDVTHYPELIMNTCSELSLKYGGKTFEISNNITEKNEITNSLVLSSDRSNIYQNSCLQAVSYNNISKDNLIPYYPNISTSDGEQSKISQQYLEDNEITSYFEQDSFASAFACSLQSLYQFDRECVSPIISSNKTTPKSEISDEFTLTTIGDYVSPLPSDIEDSFYMSPTIRELDMKPYTKYFDTEKIKNSSDPELEFSKQLGKCQAIDKAINLDYRKRQRLGLIPPDPKWQTGVVKRLRMQQRKFDRDISRRNESKKKKIDFDKKKKYDKKSNFVEIHSSDSKAIALKKTDKIFKNPTLSSIPSTSTSIRIGQFRPDPKHRNLADEILVKSQDYHMSNTGQIIQNGSITIHGKDIKEQTKEASSLIQVQCPVNERSSVTSCGNVTNSEIPLKTAEHKPFLGIVKSENTLVSVPYIKSVSSSSDTKYIVNNLKVPNEKTDIKLSQSSKKGISCFKIPFKRPPCPRIISEEKKRVVSKTEKTNTYKPPYSLLKRSMDMKSENRNKFKNMANDDKRYSGDTNYNQQISEKWIHLKKEINRRHPGVNIPGAISLLGKTELVQRNAAFQVMANSVENQMKSSKCYGLKNGSKTIQPRVKNEETNNLPSVLNMVYILNKGRELISGETKIFNNQSCTELLNKTGEQEIKAKVQPTHDDNSSKLLLSLLSTRKDLLWQNCSVLLRYADWSGNCEAKKTMMDAMATIPVNSAAILSSVATIKSIFQSSGSENRLVADAANTLLHNMGTVEEILPILFMNN